MTQLIRCPCCRQPIPAEMRELLPIFLVRKLAFEFVEQRTGFTAADLCGDRVPHDLVAARALFVWIAKTFGGHEATYTRIGAWLEMDHSSIKHLWLAIVPRLLADDEDFAPRCGDFAEFAIQSRQEKVQ